MKFLMIFSAIIAAFFFHIDLVHAGITHDYISRDKHISTDGTTPSINYEIRWKWWTVYGESVSEAIIKWDIDEYSTVTIPGESGFETITLNQLPSEAKKKISIYDVKVKVSGSFGGPTYYYMIEDAGSVFPPGSGKFSFNSPGSKKWGQLLRIKLMGQEDPYADEATARNIFSKGLKDIRIELDSFKVNLSDLHYWWRSQYPAGEYAVLRNNVLKQIDIVHKSLGYDKSAMTQKVSEIDKQARGGGENSYDYRKSDIQGAVKRLKIFSERLNKLPEKYKEHGNTGAYEKLTEIQNDILLSELEIGDKEDENIKNSMNALAANREENNEKILDRAARVNKLNEMQSEKNLKEKIKKEEEQNRISRINNKIDVYLDSIEYIIRDCGEPKDVLPPVEDYYSWTKYVNERQKKWFDCLNGYKNELQKKKKRLYEIAENEKLNAEQINALKIKLDEIADIENGIYDAAKEYKKHKEKWVTERNNIYNAKNLKKERERQLAQRMNDWIESLNPKSIEQQQYERKLQESFARGQAKVLSDYYQLNENKIDSKASKSGGYYYRYYAQTSIADNNDRIGKKVKIHEGYRELIEVKTLYLGDSKRCKGDKSLLSKHNAYDGEQSEVKVYLYRFHMLDNMQHYNASHLVKTQTEALDNIKNKVLNYEVKSYYAEHVISSLHLADCVNVKIH